MIGVQTVKNHKKTVTAAFAARLAWNWPEHRVGSIKSIDLIDIDLID